MKENMNGPFLYLGDDDVDGAAAYLAGVMTHYGLEYEHLPSDSILDPEVLNQDWSALIISDYPAGNISGDLMSAFAQRVADGMGLLMIGGWESYQGLGGEYHGTLLGNLLPVIISPDDDRVNSSGPCLISVKNNHPIIAGLPFGTDAPGVGGFNRFQAAEGSEVILESRRYKASFDGCHHLEMLSDAEPLLVTGVHGKGRVCAWASDVAPHWVGGLVDWGLERVETRGNDYANSIEVGNLYADFFSRMCRWTAGILD